MVEDPREHDATLEELERYRRDRWIVAAGILVALAGATALLFLDDAVANLAPLAALAFLLVAAGYGLIIVREERRAKEAVRAVIAERERTAGLVARIVAMESLQNAARAVVETDELDEVFDRLLAAAHELTFARSGVVLLRVGDSLTVAAGDGPDAPTRGERFSLTEGIAGAVVRTGQPLLTGRGSPWGTGVYSSSIAAPLQLPDRIVGALVVTRGSEANAFTDADVASVALLAQHAALAVRNASRLDAADRIVDELREATDARAAAVAGIVHDLKSPLSAIGGFSELLIERNDRFPPERRAELLEDIRAEATRMRELVDSLVQTASAEAGELRLDGVVDVAEIVRDVARTGHGMVLAQGSVREIRLAVGAAAPVVGDEVALRRVVANLLDNAIGHTPAGTPVDVSVTRDERNAVLRVRDHGEGLDERERELAFEPFHRRRGGGSGLGLHVVRTLVTAHGGTVRLEPPSEGTGIEAIVVLPLAPSAGSAANGSPPTGSARPVDPPAPTAARSDAARQRRPSDVPRPAQPPSPS